MNASAVEAYIARFRRVIDYIDAHLDESLDVEHLSEVAAFSKYHFHRQFTELFGIGVYKYVQLNRLKRASFRLAFRTDHKVIDIALASGYEDPESFTRAFRQNVGQSPSQFRNQPQWESWRETFNVLDELKESHMKNMYCSDDVRIVDFPATKVAVIEHRGDFTQIGETVRRFIAWRKQLKLPPAVSRTFNIAYDDPETTPRAEFRLDICVATDMEIEANEFGVKAGLLPAGRCAKSRHVGPDATLPALVHYLYSQWLPASGEELRDYPLFWERVKFFPDVPENEAIVDVFLPLK